jgi:predicted pyridoxine 5'-phosphate oxidase superfamily flavin-nucleotide-binding protein
MDYAHRRRLKILGRARVVEPGEDPALFAQLTRPDYRAHVQRAVVITVHAFDWNCPQHITVRFTEAQVEAATQPLRDRIAELEARLAAMPA